MTKTKKIELINNINDKFTNARNHGRNGSNWWYPAPNVIAYNVKMHSFADAESLRKILTKRQNEYYTNEMIWETFQETLNNEWDYLIEEAKELGAIKAWSAGRSGGWAEVEYENGLAEADEQTAKDDIEMYFQMAKSLEKVEGTVAAAIQKRLSALNKYIDSDKYYQDLREEMMDDENIGDIYRERAKRIIDKLN